MCHGSSIAGFSENTASIFIMFPLKHQLHTLGSRTPLCIGTVCLVYLWKVAFTPLANFIKQKFLFLWYFFNTYLDRHQCLWEKLVEGLSADLMSAFPSCSRLLVLILVYSSFVTQSAWSLLLCTSCGGYRLATIHYRLVYVIPLVSLADGTVLL